MTNHLPFDPLATFVAMVLLTFFILALKSFHNGYIRHYMSQREKEQREAAETYEAVTNSIYSDVKDIKHGLTEVKQDTTQLKENQRQIQETMVILHADDDKVNQERLREQVGVEDLPSDILRLGDDDFYRGASTDD